MLLWLWANTTLLKHLLLLLFRLSWRAPLGQQHNGHGLVAGWHSIGCLSRWIASCMLGIGDQLAQDFRLAWTLPWLLRLWCCLWSALLGSAHSLQLDVFRPSRGWWCRTMTCSSRGIKPEHPKQFVVMMISTIACLLFVSSIQRLCTAEQNKTKTKES